MSAGSTSRPAAGIRSAIARGLAWNGASRVVQLLSQFAATAVLARRLSPGDFGIVNMSAVFLNVANALADFGVRAYVLHRPTLDEDEIEAAKLVSWVLGLAIFATALVASVPLSLFYHEPRLAPVLAVQAVMYLVVNAGAVHSALLARALSFDRLARADIVSSVVYVLTASALAYSGAGYWSMVFGRVAASFGTLAVVSGLRRLIPRRSSSALRRRIATFGGVVAGTGALTQLDENLDNIVVGRLMGPGALGVYSVAYNVAALPQRYLAFTVAGVLNPVVAGARDVAALGGILPRYVRYQLLGPGAVAVAISVLAPEVVTILLGPRWGAAIPLVRIMGGSTALLSVATIVGGALVSRGDARALFGFHVVKLAITAAGVAVGVLHGTTGVALGFFVAAALSLGLGLRFVELRLGVAGLLRAAAAPAAVVAMTGAFGCLVRLVVARSFASSPAILTCTILLAALAHIAMSLGLLREVREDLAPSIRAWFGRPG